MTFPAAAVATALGRRPVRRQRVAGSGYGTNTSRWRVELEGGGSAFVKLALDALAADWLRREHHVYASVRAPFLPKLLGWHDDEVTLLAIEDLSGAHWPPPWPDGAVAAVLATLRDVHATAPPPKLDSLEDDRESLDGWPLVAADPRPFLSLGLVSAGWLDASLPTLAAAAAACDLAGDSFLHLDVRSDNVCLRDGRVVLVDWNWASVGNPLVDIVAWLPSLRLEGGPEPWEIVSNSGGLAALLAGFFTSRAGLPPPVTAPRVRDIQRRQGEVALSWAARELGLPDLDSGS
jgi:hypothetical protein